MIQLRLGVKFKFFAIPISFNFHPQNSNSESTAKLNPS